MSDQPTTEEAIEVVELARPLLLPKGADPAVTESSGTTVTRKTTMEELAIAQANQIFRWASSGHRLTYEDVEALIMTQIAIVNRMNTKEKSDIERLKMGKEFFRLLLEAVNSRHTLRGANPEVAGHIEKLELLFDRLIGEETGGI